MIRSQVELACDLRAAANAEFSEAAGKINLAYKEKRDTLLREHHARYDRLRDRRVHLKSFPQRSHLQDEDLAFVENEMRQHRLAGLAPVQAEIEALETQRRAEIEQLDRVLRHKLADVDMRVRRGLLSDAMSWDAGQQKYLPTPEAQHA